MNRWAEGATIETLVEFVQDRDKQMDEQDKYFEATEELATRVANLLAVLRWENSRAAHYTHGHSLHTQEVLEVLAERDC